jgi:sirohydrochlorin cobaltochelatase
MTGSSPPGPGPALLLACHGSRDDDGAEEAFALAAEVAALAPGLDVDLGFIELTAPPLSAAMAALAERRTSAGGAGHVVVVPLVLLGAGHAKTDVPASIHLARAAHPEVRFTYGAPLGLAPELLALADERLGAAVPAPLRPATGVLVVGRGTGDPDANADLHKLARLLWEGRDWPLVEAAFVGITGPRVPEGLERLRRLGADRIVVLPWFLFTGVLERRIHDQAAAFAGRHGIQVSVAGYLGPVRTVAALVLERYHQAVRGQAAMTCDLCVHRVAMPGFEDRVGSLQRPHPHPHEPQHEPQHDQAGSAHG